MLVYEKIALTITIPRIHFR